MYHSFMVRIWQEDEGEPVEFQISAESVQSGQTFRFDNLTTLLEFLHEYVDSNDLAKATGQERKEGDNSDSGPSE